MTSYKLNTDTHDLEIVNNNFVLISDSEATTQRLKTRLKTYLGEWFLNLNLGIPYYQEVFDKSIPISSIEAVFKEAIINCPGVDELNKFEIDYTNSDRSFALSFEVKAGDKTLSLEEVV